MPKETFWVPGAKKNMRFNMHLEDVQMDILSLRIRVITNKFMLPRYIRFSWNQLAGDTKAFIQMLLQIGTEREFQLNDLAKFVEGDVGKFEEFREKVMSGRRGRWPGYPNNLMLVLNIRASWEKPGLFEVVRL